MQLIRSAFYGVMVANSAVSYRKGAESACSEQVREGVKGLLMALDHGGGQGDSAKTGFKNLGFWDA